MPETLGMSIPHSIGSDTLDPQEQSLQQGLTKKSYKGVITLARRGKKGRKH